MRRLEGGKAAGAGVLARLHLNRRQAALPLNNEINLSPVVTRPRMKRISQGTELLGHIVLSQRPHERTAQTTQNVSALRARLGNKQARISLIDFKYRRAGKCLQGAFDVLDEAATHYRTRQRKPVEGVTKKLGIATRTDHLVLKFAIILGKLLGN